MTPDLHPGSDPRRIEYVPLDELTPAEVNPRTHALDSIVASIERFGYVLPGAVDERTGRLVAGHGRHEALAQLRDSGADPPDGIRVASGGPAAPGDDGAWLVPIYRGWASADDVEAQAYLLADNELTIQGGWMRDPLADVLSTVQASPAGLAGTGFTDERLRSLLDELGRTAPSFAPTDAAGPRLDQLAPDMIECPHCHQSFDRRQL